MAVPAAQLRPHSERRGHRARLQATAAGRARLARHEDLLDLRPLHHRKEDRIRAHVQLCWLALLLIRIAENQTGDTWRNVRRELQRLHQGTFRGNAGLAHKTSETTAAQLRILRALGLQAPPTFPALQPAA